VAAEGAVAVDHVGLTVEHRLQQGRDLLRCVLQVGVAHDDVAAGRRGRGGADGRPLAPVDRMLDPVDPGVDQGVQHTHRAVCAAVVDDDEFDVARILHVENPLDRRRQRRFLVENRHQDGQRHRQSRSG